MKARVGRGTIIQPNESHGTATVPGWRKDFGPPWSQEAQSSHSFPGFDFAPLAPSTRVILAVRRLPVCDEISKPCVP